MKRLLIFTAYLFVIQLHPKSKSFHKCKTIYAISLIDHYCESGNYIQLRLSDIPFPIQISNCDSNRNLLLEAYQKGIVLTFQISENRIIKVTTPNDSEAFEYLKSYVYIPPVELEYVHFQNLTKANLKGLFNIFLQKKYHCFSDNFGLESGCEIRSGIIAEFLQQVLNIESFKLFLKGRLLCNIKGRTYHWSNHVINLIPVIENNQKSLLVFDPFSHQPIQHFESFINTIISEGSIIQDSYLANCQTLSLNFPSKKGIVDFNFQSLGLLIKNLKQYSSSN